MDDKNLIAKSKSGDIEAFELLIEQYQPMVYNLSYKMLGNYDDASDAAQDALIKIYKKINTFQEKSKFSTWIYRLTYNVCLDKLRQRKNISTQQLDEEIVDKELTPQFAVEKNERIQKIYDAINSLSPEYKAAIIMRDVNGHSYDEIAEILGCSIGTVKSRINRGRTRLKEILSDYLEHNTANKRQNN